MSHVGEMSVPSASLTGAVVAAVIWLAWAFLSETRHNHGFWVAFLLPLAPVIIPVLWSVYALLKYASSIVFIVLRRREDHEEFMRKLKIRSGIFLFFK